MRLRYLAIWVYLVPSVGHWHITEPIRCLGYFLQYVLCAYTSYIVCIRLMGLGGRGLVVFWYVYSGITMLLVAYCSI